ncbi:F0F1 ATP synthase subunit B [Patescibacteria group bacterium]|nr:F0F1 ATP synthase subunit B [Patescibacteria group bacterium]MBU1663481.1 F0F1 ATP synthase subunit B [Patescibacteria group bacterium]MBU1933726.1 F0F1 ATP synthase subunit B [Patescibacteria group bacterium]MBU2007672.1 F0F1 ATP synthase subunit B [Patescibacteria group bacterium]MBU2263939.1 F0F1 ATP synthase subunit B [Patescibacteria group bacterium]
MELLQAFGLNIKILIAQLINFAILLLILYKFGYRPILKFLEDRKNTIEQGVIDAKKAVEKLEEISKKEKEIIIKAKKEAKLILQTSREQGEKRHKEIVDKAKYDIGQIINQKKAKMQIEKAATLKEIKKEVADLVIATVEKILVEKVDAKKDNEIIRKIITN